MTANRIGETMAVPTAAYPKSDLDPFAAEYLADPHPAQEALREAGPAVRLTRYNVWAVGALPGSVRHPERLA